MGYICNCRGFTDDDMKKAVKRNPDITLGELYMLSTGGKYTRPNCGACCSEFRDKVEEVTGRKFTAEEFTAFKQSSVKWEEVMSRRLAVG